MLVLVAFRPAVFDRHFLRHDITGLSKALSKTLHLWRHRAGIKDQRNRAAAARLDAPPRAGTLARSLIELE